MSSENNDKRQGTISSARFNLLSSMVGGGSLSCIKMTGEDDAKTFVLDTMHAMSFKVCLHGEKTKINVFDTGWGISYFIWWEGNIMMKEGITDFYYKRHSLFNMIPPWSCLEEEAGADYVFRPVVRDRSRRLWRMWAQARGAARRRALSPPPRSSRSTARRPAL